MRKRSEGCTFGGLFSCSCGLPRASARICSLPNCVLQRLASRGVYVTASCLAAAVSLQCFQSLLLQLSVPSADAGLIAPVDHPKARTGRNFTASWRNGLRREGKICSQTHTTHALDLSPAPGTHSAIRATAMRRKAKTMVPPLQQADFDALPISVQYVEPSKWSRCGQRVV